MSALGNTFLRSSYAMKDVDKLSEGIQVLREYVFFKQMNLLKTFADYDPMDTGKLSQEKFESALRRSPYEFSDSEVKQIIVDAPKNFKDEILYRDLHFLISRAKKPEQKYTLKVETHPFKVSAGSEETIVRNLEEFWLSKSVFDFSHYNLIDIDVNQIRNSKRASEHFVNATTAVYEKFANYNNDRILENFQIQVSRDMCARLTKLDNNPQIEKEIQIFFLKYLRLTQETAGAQMLIDDFIRLISKFSVTLTRDETTLLHYLMLEHGKAKTMTYQIILSWLLEFYKKKMMSMVQNKAAGELADRGEPVRKYPTTQKAIFEVISKTGVDAFSRPLKLLAKQDKVKWEDFLKFLRDSHLIFSRTDLSDLKLWLANEGHFTMDGYDSFGIKGGDVYLKASGYIKYLTEFYQKNLFDTVKDALPLDFDEALVYFQKHVYSCYLKKIEQVYYLNKQILSSLQRLGDFADSGRMVDEINFRESLRDMVPTLSNSTIDLLFKNLKHIEEPTSTFFHRKLYIDEFFNMLNRKSFAAPKQAEEVYTSEEFKAIIKNKIDHAGDVPSIHTAPLKLGNEPAQLSEILEKLYTILDQLQPQVSDNKDRTPEALTIPLVKIFKYHDTENKGYLAESEFQELILNYFPILSYEEIRLLTNMGTSLTNHDEKAKNSSGTIDPARKNTISYVYFLLQIEKYLSYQHPERFIKQSER